MELRLLKAVLLATLLGTSSAAALAKAKTKAAKKPKAAKRPAAAGGGFGAKPAKPAKSSKSAQEKAVDQAIAAKAQALRVSPDLPGSWLELGALMAQTKEYAEAERIFRAGAAFVPVQHRTRELARGRMRDTRGAVTRDR